MTQNILSAMNSDTVDTINGTAESTQVAQHIQDTYFKLMNERNWEHTFELDSLVGLGDVTQPTKMQMPANTLDIDFIKYDRRTSVTNPPAFTDIAYLTPHEFISVTANRDATLSTVEAYVEPITNVTINVRNDVGPMYWTSFDDDYIWFDAYNSNLEATLQESKSIVHIVKEPTWTASDGFVPDLPTHMFPLLLAQAKSACFTYVKQAPSQLEERDAFRQRIARQKRGRREQFGNKRMIHYGR